MLRIKDPRMLSRILTSDLKAQPGQLCKLQCMLIGIFIGDRLEMPSAMVADSTSFESLINQQYALLQRSNARNAVNDINEVVPLDTVEAERIAKAFWVMRYHGAAPKTTMSVAGVNSFAERYLNMNQVFNQAEIDFLDNNRDNIAVAYNLLNECLVKESLV